MNTRKHISRELGITEQYVSMLFSGERKVSWPLAEKLSEILPGKSIKEWKHATPEELKRAFLQLREAI